MRHSIPPGAAIAMLGALALWNCGGGGSASTPTSPTAASAPAPTAAAPAPTATTTPATTTVSVAIVSSSGNSAFSPNPVKANAGDTVTFRNTDGTVHHLVMDDGSGDFGDVNPGATSRGVVLRNANATTFHCTLHPTMVGSINGAFAPDTPPCVPDIYGYGC